jgi:hypothetical protein
MNTLCSSVTPYSSVDRQKMDAATLSERMTELADLLESVLENGRQLKTLMFPLSTSGCDDQSVSTSHLTCKNLNKEN